MRNLLLCGAILAVSLIAGAIFMVLDRRATDLEAAGHEATSLALALAAQTSREFGTADFVARNLLKRIAAAGIGSPGALAAEFGTENVQGRLRDEIAGMSEIDVAGIVGSDGKLINTSRQWPVPNLAVDKSDFFRPLQDEPPARLSAVNPTPGLFISEPIMSHVTGRKSILLARRITAPDGGFLGVVYSGIRLDFFEALYRAVSNGDGRLVELRHRDGRLLARFPEPDGPYGEITPDDEIFGAIRQGFSAARSLSRSPVDGKIRLRSLQALDDFPLIVLVGREESAILTSWRRQTIAIGCGTALAVAALLAAIALLTRQIGRRVKSEAVLSATLEHMSQGIITITADGRVPVHNRRFLEMLEIPAWIMRGSPALADVLRFQWAKGEFGSDGAALPGSVREAILAGGAISASYNYERRRTNGAIIEVNSMNSDNGSVVRTYTDVTVSREREAALQAALHERDQAETALLRHRDDLERDVAERSRALAQSEARHRDVAEVASDWFWETDADNFLIFVSSRFVEAAGVPRERVVGRPLSTLVELGFDLAGMHELRTAMDARRDFKNVVHSVVLPFRGVRFWGMSGKPFIDPVTGVFAGYRGTGTDTTAAVEREAALNDALQRTEEAEQDAWRSRTLLVDAIEAIPEGFVLHDAEDRLIMCNRRYGEMYGLAAHLMKPGALFEDTLRVTAEDRGFFLDGQEPEVWVAERLASHRACAGAYIEQRLANGHWIQAAERRTSDGGTVGITVDVTVASLREAAEGEREKLAALGQLAGGVAHEINNLLQPAITLPEMVRDRLPEADLESREDLDCVVDGVRKIREIVRNILLFARREEPVLAKLDLIAELRSSLAFVRDLLPPSVTLLAPHLEAHAGCFVAANKTQLIQVLTNLLVNAAQALKGAGTITVSTARIEPSTEEAAALSIKTGLAYLAVSVADTGPGMDMATQRRVFEPFFTTKPVGKGTGLGLSVVHGILRSWEGGITVDSALGQGATFTLYMPID